MVVTQAYELLPARTVRARWPTTSRSLASAAPKGLFGISVSGVPRTIVRDRGHRDDGSRIQSVLQAVRVRVGVTSLSGTARRGAPSVWTGAGFPFDSLMAVELNGDRTMNPLVNAGAEPSPASESGAR